MTGMLAVPAVSWVPAASGLSAYRTRVVHIALARPQVTAKYQRLGSMVSMAPEDIAPVRVPLATPALGAPAVVLPEGAELAVLPEEHAASRAATAARATAPTAALTRRG